MTTIGVPPEEEAILPRRVLLCTTGEDLDTVSAVLPSEILINLQKKTCINISEKQQSCRSAGQLCRPIRASIFSFLTVKLIASISIISSLYLACLSAQPMWKQESNTDFLSLQLI